MFLWRRFEILADQYVFVSLVLGRAPEGNNREMVLAWILASNADMNRNELLLATSSIKPIAIIDHRV